MRPCRDTEPDTAVERLVRTFAFLTTTPGVRSDLAMMERRADFYLTRDRNFANDSLQR